MPTAAEDDLYLSTKRDDKLRAKTIEILKDLRGQIPFLLGLHGGAFFLTFVFAAGRLTFVSRTQPEAG